MAAFKISPAQISPAQTYSAHKILLSTRAVVLFSFAFLLFISTDIFAAAGTPITATATVSYDISGIPGTSSAATTFVEDRRVNFSVTESNGGLAVPVISNMTGAVMRFTVTNLGNSAQDFLLTAIDTTPNPFGTPAVSFTPLSMQVFVESGGEPGNGYIPVQDTAIFIDELNPNEVKTIYVVSNLPAALSADAVAAVAMVAQAAEGGAPGVEGAAINADDNGHVSPGGIFSNGSTNMPAGTPNTIPDSPATMETVFNDPAGLDPEDISTALIQDVVSNGQHSEAGAYQVMSPVNILKTVTVIDALGGSDPQPGATLRYQLDVSVTGNTAVDGLIISDVIPANTTYTDNSIQLNSAAQTDANDVPTDYSRAIDVLSKPVLSVEVDLSEGGAVSVAPGVTNVIIFEVTID